PPAALRTWDSRAQLGEKGIALALGAERRRRPVARVDRRLRREALCERAHRVEQRLPVAAGEVDAADAVLEQQVSGEERAVRREREVVRRVARDCEHVEVDSRELESFAAVELDVDRVLPEGQ